jgi:hypothetical protein
MQEGQVSFQNRLPSREASSVELAQILGSHGQSYIQTFPTSSEQRKVIRDIIGCRTATLGGHLEACGNGCGYERLWFHSCRNRHCPKCQNLQKARWLLERSEKLLPTSYFHVVVTLPHELGPLILQNRERLYNLLFDAARKALIELAKGYKRLGVLPGFTAILHTWSQELRFHVHLHLVVTAGGLSLAGDRWIPAKNNFLVPVRALSKMVRGKFLDRLQEAFDQKKIAFSGNITHWRNVAAFKKLTRKLRRTKWVVYAQPPFHGPRHVFSYLGHYTHRVAISNHRLLAFDGQTVTFRARDNNQPGTYRQIRLAAQEFIRRFLLHVLPQGFVRIRHFGLMASRNAQTKLEKARLLLQASLSTTQTLCTKADLLTWQQLLLKLTGIDLTLCPNCGGTILRKPLPHNPLCLAPVQAFSKPPLDTS